MRTASLVVSIGATLEAGVSPAMASALDDGSASLAIASTSAALAALPGGRCTKSSPPNTGHAKPTEKQTAMTAASRPILGRTVSGADDSGGSATGGFASRFLLTGLFPTVGAWAMHAFLRLAS